MRTHHRSPLSPRPAFTLVELIVAMAVIAVLAGLAVLIFPRLQDSQQASKAAEQVQGTYFAARLMAMRDQLPRGVRLVPTLDTDGVYRVHQLQYIEQPAYFLPPGSAANPPWSNSYLLGIQNLVNPPSGPNPSIGVFSNVDFWGGNGPGQPSLWPVQPGDYLDLMGNNKPDGLYRILSVNQSPDIPGTSDNLTLGQVSLNSQGQPVPQPSNLPTNPVVQPPVPPIQLVASGYKQVAYYVANPPNPPLPDPTARLTYRILRGPRPMIGQPPVNLPADVIVDLPGFQNMPHPVLNGTTFGSILQPDSQTNQFDIMFSPAGNVLRDAGNQGKAVLWVWNSLGNPMADEQTLVVIYTRTGMVASQPVDLSSGNPYSFILDGRSSGM